MKWTPRRMKWLLNIYGPYVGAGVRVTHLSEDWYETRVEMRLRWYNRNVMGTQFGGSLYAMVDPHLALMLMRLLGREYTVWDKAASIDFVKPGRGRVHATIRISPQTLDDIRRQTATGQKYLPQFDIAILNNEDELVAKVHKVLYVRRKKP